MQRRWHVSKRLLVLVWTVSCILFLGIAVVVALTAPQRQRIEWSSTMPFVKWCADEDPENAR